jgi:hypothetical protein
MAGGIPLEIALAISAPPVLCTADGPSLTSACHRSQSTGPDSAAGPAVMPDAVPGGSLRSTGGDLSVEDALLVLVSGYSLVGLARASAASPSLFSKKVSCPCSSCALSVANRSFRLGLEYGSPSSPSAIADSFAASVDVAEPPVSLRSLVSGRGGTGDGALRMLLILPKSAPNPLDALRARLPGTGGGDMLPEESFLGDVVVLPFVSESMSLVGDWRPEIVSSGLAICSLMLGWLTLTGNLGETLLCRPWKGF